jgi:hypothetical protein
VQYNIVRTHQDGDKNFAVKAPCGQMLQLNAELETSIQIIAISNSSHQRQMKRYSKAVPLHTVRTYRCRGTAPFILNLSTRWRGVVSLKAQLLYPWRKSHHYPLSRRLGGPHSQLEYCGKHKNLISLLGFISRLSRVLYSVHTNYTIMTPEMYVKQK